MSVVTLERRLASVAARLAPPAQPLAVPEMAERLRLALDPWQVESLESQEARILLNASRQSGKSTVAALRGLHEILSAPDRLVLCISPSERQSKLLFRSMLRYWRALGKPVPAAAENVLSLELANGSAAYALPGAEDTVRGFSAVNLLLIDEASRVPEDLIAAVRPMLAVSGGRLIALSTPWGKRGWWYEAWEHGGDAWARWRVPASECPRISPAFLAEERRALGPLWFASEFECQFVDTVDQLYATDLVQAALSRDVAPLGLPSFGGAA